MGYYSTEKACKKEGVNAVKVARDQGDWAVTYECQLDRNAPQPK
jgi:hypothetical protein